MEENKEDWVRGVQTGFHLSLFIFLWQEKQINENDSALTFH